MSKCDIIIPIYNAYDALVECIESVLKNTNMKDNGLILIDDCSTDSRIKEYLKELEDKKNNIIVLYNKSNLGFVGTVNKGMKYSKNDVLLLNSDTVVGKDWLEKIKSCAYSMEKVATVTPLSNNATLASVPRGLEKNEISLDIDKYNKLVSECSYKEYPEIPTGHGFCMFIKREVLDLVGYFDEETYGKGYGEENDFSFRCRDYGYRNILCDDVVVYHKESQSFSSKRQKVIEDHLRKLENRYPEYKNNLDIWCQKFPIKYIGKNIGYYSNIINRKNILILIHDFENSVGGTTLHLLDLINNLKDKYNFHVLYPVDEGYKLRSYFKDDEFTIKLPFIEKFEKFNRYNNEYRKMIEDLVLALGIDVVHIHHMISHYFDVIDIAKKYNIKSIITLHDYYSLCPTINMLYCGEKFCMDMKNKDCKKCLALSNKIDHNIIDNWRSDWHNFLKKFDKIIVPSEDTKKRILSVYKDLSIDAIEHGIDITDYDYDPKFDTTFNIAMIGVLCNHKGGNIFNKLIKYNKNSSIKFHAFGKSEIDSLKHNKNNYIFHGKYKRDNLNDLLKENNINLICFFQIWPETYSYTLNEAVSAGIPILTFDIGAGAERVKKYGLGWTIDLNSTTQDINNKIQDILNNKDDYEKIKRNIKNYKIKSTKEMAEEYKEFYNISKNKKPNIEKLKEIIKQEQVNESGYGSEMLNRILNSTKWKLINKIKFPNGFIKLVRNIKSKKRG